VARLEVRRARIDREEGRTLDARRRLDAIAAQIQRVDGIPPERSLWLLEVAALKAASGQADHAIAILKELEMGLTRTDIRLPPWERLRAGSVANAVSSRGSFR
jgi:hypothetical protein